MAFEPASATPPISFHTGISIDAALPEIAANRLKLLQQRVSDLRSLTIPFDQRHEAGVARLEAERTSGN